ncbi:hypothetical protein SALBM311S_12871 [Streptomyces alboniger]
MPGQNECFATGQAHPSVYVHPIGPPHPSRGDAETGRAERPRNADAVDGDRGGQDTQGDRVPEGAALHGSRTRGTAASTALGGWRTCGSSYGEPPAHQVRAALTTIALSIPPSEVSRAVRASVAPGTAASATHRYRLALRTNHPEMSLLRSPTDRTLGPPEPVEEDRHTPHPV